MKLKKLFKDINVEFRGSKELEIKGLSNNSKRIVPGQLFIARKGRKYDGNQYTEEAIESGAIAVLSENYNPFFKNITQIIHPNPSCLEPLLASRFYENPSHELHTIAVTGTSGKTSVSSLIHELLGTLDKQAPELSGRSSCGLIGTLGVDTGRGCYPTGHTTPDSLVVQKMLREMVSNGCSLAVLEVTSHGLEQGRVACIDFEVGIFTNLSHDHLDYHETMQQYAEAKSQLFNSSSYAKKMRVAIVNGDDPHLSTILKDFKGSIWRYGKGPESDFKLLKISPSPDLTYFSFSYKECVYNASTLLPGEHNVFNCLAAIATLFCFGHEIDSILKKLATIESIRGRLERVKTPYGAVYVDYSHKPDALAAALSTLREVHGESKITCIFGCGGDRDRSKRPTMGKIAQENSDFAIVTSDNPRSESPMAIIEEVLSGMKRKNLLVEPDRALAIAKGLESLDKDGVLLIAGKGHETYQIVGHRVLSFDDAEVVREWFSKESPLCN